MKRSRGFTLIELMIVIVVVAILATIAVASYSRYAFRARRTEGQQLAMQIANAEENYYGVHNQYTADMTLLGLAALPLSSNGYYSAVTTATTVNGAANQGYLVTASIIGGTAQANDACGALTIDNTGSKNPNNTSPLNSINGSCW